MTQSRSWIHHDLGRELSNWGRWGADDEVGTLNLVTPAKRVQAAGLVRTGKAINLGIDIVVILASGLLIYLGWNAARDLT